MNTLAKSLSFFFIFHLSFLNSVNSTCPNSFHCGDHLGYLEFPLSNSSQPECGLFMVNCTNSTDPRIQLGDGGRWYRLVEKVSFNNYKIEDPSLQNDLRGSNLCLSLRNLSLPNSPSSSLTFFPNITLFICDNNRSENTSSETLENYRSYTECGGFTVYYRQPTDNFHAEENSLFQGCTVVHMPIKSNQETGGLLNLLSAEFTLEWTVSADCTSCVHRGGQCLVNSFNEFQCNAGLLAGNVNVRKIILLVAGVLSASVTCLLSIFIVCMRRRKNSLLKSFQLQKANTKNERDIELFLKNNGNLAPRRYKYSELKKITKSFNENIGKGGYGNVYKGKLYNGCVVAVKILNESKGNGEEFINEVASISRTSHVNIVTLVGFCFEGSKRALIYEFMPNGSLDKFLKNAASSSAENGLGREKLFEIAVGIGRGLEYLHRGCNTRILHFDIKPHNILLDKNLNPKISDFGLAKLCPNRSSIVSMLEARGTIGYIAPEVFCRNFGEVSHKSDVYSYGMMVLEMVGGRNDLDTQNQIADGSSEAYFPDYVYKQLEMNAENRSFDGIGNEENEWQSLKRKLMIVGLWCIQTDPKNRPSMNGVLEMLEGKVESLQIPPKPYYSSSPPRLALPNVTIPESIQHSAI